MTKKNKIIIYIVIGIQFIFLLFGAIDYLKTKDSVYKIDYHELIGTTIPDDRDGWYIDTSFPCLDDGLFDYSKDYDMKPGMYRITVNYETDTNKCYSTIRATTTSPQALRVDQVPLPAELTSVTYDMYLLEHVSDFSVRNYYAKEGYLIVKDITIVKTRLLPRMLCFIFAIFFMMIDFVLIQSIRRGSLRQFLIDYKVQIFIILAAVYASIPIMDGGVVFGIDCNFHLLRIEGIVDGIRGGQFPVKLQTNWIYGYGYATSLYYGDLFLGIAAFLRLIGFSVQLSYKLLLFLINLATMSIMYWCTFKISQNKLVSYTCGLIYLLIPFRIYDMYPRAALGETIAITFYPLIVYGIWKTFTGDSSEKQFRKLWIPLVIGFTGIIESHMLSCVMCGLLIIFVCLVNIKKVFEKERFVVLFKTVLYTTGFNAWFIFPCITSMDNLDVVQPYRRYLQIQHAGLQISELFGRPDVYLSAGITFGIALGMFFYLVSVKEDENSDSVLNKSWVQMFILTFVSLWSTTIYFPWNRLLKLLGRYGMFVSNIQFPWRLLGVATALGCFVICISLMKLKRIHSEQVMNYISVGLIIVSAISASWLLVNDENTSQLRTVYDMDATGNTRWYVDEYVYCVKPNNTLEDYYENCVKSYDLIPGHFNASENVFYQNFEQRDTVATIYCENRGSEEGYVEIPLLYYKQYKAFDENESDISLTVGTKSVVRVMLPANYSGQITISYIHPISWRIYELISLLCIMLAIFYAFYSRKRR